MKKYLIALVGAAALTAMTSAPAAIWTYTAGLNQEQVVTPIGDPNPFAAGIGTFTYDDSTSVFSWVIGWTNLASDLTVAHIHEGAIGVSSGVIPIDILAAPAVVSTTGGVTSSVGASLIVSPADVAILTSGGVGDAIDWYVNVHTAGNPAGEIRGQLFVASVVPLPAAAWLMIPALGGFTLFGRRKA